MESITNLLLGLVRVEAKGSRTEDVLNLCAANGVRFWDAKPVDEFTLHMSVFRRDIGKTMLYIEKAQCSAKILRQRGVPFFVGRLKTRYTLFVGLALCIFTLLCSSLFIWDIEVVGNSEVSSSDVLNALEEIGIGIGTYWPSIITDSVRSLVLSEIPELSWLTVNVYGSHAEVIVRERVPKPVIVSEDITSNVYAAKPGIITEVRAYRGVPQVKPGQTVTGGELLVSSEVVSLLADTRNVHAMADVTARTWHELTVVEPLDIISKQYTGRDFTRNALVIGNMRINFYFSSGILDRTCDKIIMESKFALGDIFTLPIAVISERYAEYETVTSEYDVNLRQRDLESLLMSRLLEVVGAEGEVVTSAYSAVTKDGALYVTLRAECLERISEIRELP